MPGGLRKYHVVFTDGTERDVTARKMDVENNGALVFTNSDVVLAIGDGQWKYVEVERLDDKG